MSKTPFDLSFEDLSAAGRSASLRADGEARAAGLIVAGNIVGTVDPVQIEKPKLVRQEQGRKPIRRRIGVGSRRA